jgi:hypothetical protein
MKSFTLVFLFAGMFSCFSYSQTATTIAALRSLGATSGATIWFISDVGREGMFALDPRDGSSADNGGTVIVSGTKRFKRVYTGAIDGRWFGMVADYNGLAGTDNSPALNAAIAGAKNNETVLIPDGQYLFRSTITLPLTSVKKVRIEARGTLYFNKVTGFILEGGDQEFRSYGMIVGMNTGASTEAAYAAYTGEGLLLKNTIQCHIEVNEVKDFRYGIHMTGSGSGESVGCQYNQIRFNWIHHNYVQIRLSTQGTSAHGNWNNESNWYGGQVGRGIPGVTYGGGGWYGIVMTKDPGSNASENGINGHNFYNVGFEGVEKALVMNNSTYNSFFGGGLEPEGLHVGLDLDPVTAVGNRFIGVTTLTEQEFVDGRMGMHTVIGGHIWGGVPGSTAAYMGYSAVNSVTPNKMLVTTNIYNYTNFIVNKTHDLISQTGQYPTIQAMMYRLNGVIRSVPYKKTFLHVTAATTGSPVTLPANIGCVRVEATQEKVFKIDVGDMAAYGEEFLVEYLSPQFPISFVRSDNSAVLIPATAFPSGGTYRCLWANGQYKISKIGGEYLTYVQGGGTFTIQPGIAIHYVNWPYGNAVTTLPSANLWPGRQITIKNMVAGKTVQVVGVSASDEALIQSRGSMTVVSDGSTWNITAMYRKGTTY